MCKDYETESVYSRAIRAGMHMCGGCGEIGKHFLIKCN